MPRYAELTAGYYDGATFTGAGTNNLVQTTAGVLYAVFINQELDVEFRKSTDGGITWGQGTIVFAGSATQLAVWYDRWSNIAAGLIHLAYTESVTDDTLYRTINTESSDALSTQTVIHAGTSTAANCMLSIVRAVGGNVYCRTMIDAGAEGAFYRLVNANVPNGAWGVARTINEANATQDQILLLPDYDAADTQDIMGVFIDASANQIDRILYDDSGNSWSLTNIAACTDGLASTAFPHFSVAHDIANTRYYLAFWNAVDAVNADLQVYRFDSGTITALTDVVTNSTDDQGLCRIGLDIDTGYLHVWYCGITTGGETFSTSMHNYKKVSTDGGTTWGPETRLSSGLHEMQGLIGCPRFNSVGRRPMGILAGTGEGSPNTLRYIVDIVQPRAAHQMFGG